MRAIAMERFGGTEQLKPTDLPRPRPERGEILLRIVAAGVNPVDCKIRAGELQDVFPNAFPTILGFDAAGVVEELGEDTSRFRKGDRVWTYARKPKVQWGCYAEYVSVPEEQVALMPSKLLFEEAAAVPVVGLTAFQCLLGGPPIGKDSTVLVHAGAGGVGHLAIQLAKNAGAKVLGTAGSANQEFIMSLGAYAGIDYTQEDFTEAVQRHFKDGVDFVLDTIGGEVQTRSLSVLKPGGRLVSIAQPPDEAAAVKLGVTVGFVATQPDGEQLAQLARMIDKGGIRGAHVQKIFPLAEAAQAHQTVEAGHVRGKLVLNL